MARKPILASYTFSQGEVSDHIEARPDFGKRYNGARTVENFWLFPEGGGYRRPGLRWIANVKTSSLFTMLVPFENSTTDSFIIELGNTYARFIKNRSQILSAGNPYELVTPFLTADLRDLDWEQSQDFLFFTSLNASYDVQKLIRVADDNWTISNFGADPPPSFDADELITVVVAPNANTGASVTIRAGSDYFLAGDVGRQFIQGTGRANISAQSARQLTVSVIDALSATITASGKTLTSSGTTVTSTGHGRSAAEFVILTAGAQSGEIRQIASITDPDTFEIDAAFSVDQAAPVAYSWTAGFAANATAFRLAPQVTMDVDKKEPIGAFVSMVGGSPGFRSTYVGKYVRMLGGTIKIVTFTNSTTMTGQIKAILSDSTNADPSAVAAQAWRLQTESWSSTQGRPRSVTTHQGRIVFGGTAEQPTSFWGSSIADIYNFAVGALADDAYEYTIQGGNANPIQWMVSLLVLYLGTTKREYSAKGSGIDTPIGGEDVPFVAPISDFGSMHIKPTVVDSTIIMLQRFARDVVILAYSLNESPDANTFVGNELTIFARQISDMGFAQHRSAYAQKPDSIVFYPLNNGQLAGLTFKARQEVQGLHRTVTDGTIESVATVPNQAGTGVDVYVVVARTLNGQTVRSIEVFDDTLQTDSAVTGAISTGATTITGLTRLANETVDVLIGGDYKGQKVVSAGGVVTLAAEDVPEADTTYEVGLHYDSTLTTLRPSIPGEVTELVKRYWPIVAVRLKNTIGGKINGKPMKPQNGNRPFTGLAVMENVQTTDSYDGAITITQDQPYAMTVLNVAGKVAFGDDFA